MSFEISLYFRHPELVSVYCAMAILNQVQHDDNAELQA